MLIHKIEIGSTFKIGNVEIKVTGISIFRLAPEEKVGEPSDVKITVERRDVGAADELSCHVLDYESFLRQLDGRAEVVE